MLTQEMEKRIKNLTRGQPDLLRQLEESIRRHGSGRMDPFLQGLEAMDHGDIDADLDLGRLFEEFKNSEGGTPSFDLFFQTVAGIRRKFESSTKKIERIGAAV